MWFTASEIERGSRHALPREVYASHVNALFEGVGTFAIGVMGSSATIAIAGALGGHNSLLTIATGLAVLGGVRLWSMSRFAAVSKGLDHAGLKRWERWYIIGGSAYLLLLGLSDLAAFGFTDDDFARLACLVVTMAYLVGTPGRSFASPLLVNAQILAAAVPVLLGMSLAGGAYWWIVGLVMVPFFVVLKSISTRLNGIFVAAVLHTREIGRLATLFDTALNNMPHGLAMFEGDRVISVVNRRLLTVLGMESDSWQDGSTLDDLIAAWRKVGPTESLAKLLAGQESLASDHVVTMANGRSMALRLQMMEAGRGVLLVEDVTERVRAQDEINHLARYDSLTGMRNRASFRSTVKTASNTPSGGRAALLFIDLDRFKAVNDTLGHVAGDRLLMRVAERLKLAAGPDAILGRFGGDEFVMFRIFRGGRAAAEEAAGAIIRHLSQPYEVDGQRVTVGASVGIAMAGTSSWAVDDLLRDADLALYRAKVEGRGMFRVFEDDMKFSAEKRRRTEEDLRGAAQRGELVLYYQPIYSVRKKRFVSCEALVRWQHPTRGLVPPSEFIPVAEETGLISEIGHFVLRQACTDCLNWPDNIGVAVNFSAAQFSRGNVPRALLEALDETGLAPGRLEVEITESLLINDLQETTLALLQIKAAGIKLALDDFGTGFSSLSYLQSLPFNTVKIDRSFLNGLDRESRAMVLLRGIQGLAANLGMEVVMEGVETAEQMSLVVDVAQIGLVQGYYMSRPVPASEIPAVLGIAARPPFRLKNAQVA